MYSTTKRKYKMNTINEQALNDFLACMDIVTEDRVAEIAKNHNVKLSVAEDILMDCCTNIATDDYTQKSLYNEYNGDGIAFGKWFDSYVVDTLIEALHNGYID